MVGQFPDRQNLSGISQVISGECGSLFPVIRTNWDLLKFSAQ
jgi:hypothetical protein